MGTPGSRAAQYVIPEPTEEERNATENQNFNNTPKVRVMTGVEVEANPTVKRRSSTNQEIAKRAELKGNAAVETCTDDERNAAEDQNFEKTPKVRVMTGVEVEANPTVKRRSSTNQEIAKRAELKGNAAVETCTDDERNAAEDQNFEKTPKVRVMTGVEVETNPTVKRRPSTNREKAKREELKGNAAVETCTVDDIGITRDAEEESREHEEDEDYDKNTPSTSNTQPQNTGIPDQSLPDTTSLENNEEADKAKQTLEAKKSTLPVTPLPATEPPTGVDNQLSITVQPSTSRNSLFKPNKVSPSILSATADNGRYTLLQRISCGCFKSGGQ